MPKNGDITIGKRKVRVEMPNLGYDQADTNLSAYRDGWQRTFEGYPKLSDAVRKMLQEYLKRRQHNRIILFFVGHCGYSKDRSNFLLREMIRGNL